MLGAATSPLAAQTGLRVSVLLPASGALTTTGPTISIENAFADERSRELLQSGFPARVTVTVELWASRTLFDDLISTTSAERIVRFDVLSKTYRVAEPVADSIREVGRYTTLDSARATITRFAFRGGAPAERRKLYYTVQLTIETFNSNDLVEVQRWLNGEAQPAIKGEKNPASALSRGFLTLFSRLLGGDVKRQKGRSVFFDT
jgi:hypothetical protein